MQRALTTVEHWCEEEQLRVNPTKTTLVSFTKRRKLEPIRNIKFYGENLRLEDEVKYLGITLDKKLSFKKHVIQATNKATKTLMYCKRMFGRSWGLSPKMVHWMYTTMVRPIITYAAPIWWHAAEKRTVIQILNKTQRIACLGITGAMSTTPTAALENLIGLSPLHLVVRAEAITGAKRLLSNGATILSKDGHNALFDKIQDLGRLALRTDRTKVTYLDKPFIIKEKRGPLDAEANRLRQRGYSVWHTATKRSKIGVAVGMVEDEQQGRQLMLNLGLETTNLQASIIGIQTCVQLMREGLPRGKTFAIFTGDQAATLALQQFETKSRTVQSCWEDLRNLAEAQNKPEIILAENMGNNKAARRAIQLATQGASNSLVGPEPTCYVSDKTWKREIGNWLTNQNKFYWEQLPKMEQSKQLIGSPPFKKGENILGLSRQQLRKVAGLLTGHAPSRKHLHTLGKSVTSLCRGCNEEDETTLHILCFCEAFNQTRATFLGKEKPAPEGIRNLPLGTILDFLEATELNLWD
ncbi:uncharacterized protein LOC126745359 isoform X3 [Anthonomus grandis grandis]|uniref:uncharacterized protein LOC126745359 isoform X3 n=1 Tax=Anthonomus grandis grandis TaxID=2921223 RepID=UPI0021652C4A|nr:uncharacterized protein LOC126745359 isoform X3 [Anthonomus grandis grandis]XP_050309136.1 uncharacterized protein LOC126745359 isoform X3 [Anthonomus grandis grandis]